MAFSSQSCPKFEEEWPESMPCPKFLCSCPPEDTCLHCRPELWHWEPKTQKRSTKLLSTKEVETAMERSKSSPLVTKNSLLEMVRKMVLKAESWPFEVERIKGWEKLRKRVFRRALHLAREWSVEQKTSLYLWLAENYPDDLVAVNWWTDVFLDRELSDHSYESLVGQSCITWDEVEGFMKKTTV